MSKKIKRKRDTRVPDYPIKILLYIYTIVLSTSGV